MLRQKCPTFCSPNDVTLYKGIEHLQRSNNVGSQREKEEHLDESLRLFSNVAEKLEFPKIEEIVASYKSLKYRTGIINLVLLVAKKLDPANLALIFLKNGKPSGADLRSEEAYKKRVKLYKLIFDMISSLELLPGIFLC
jgi:nuclear pore complex protein Nup155